MIEHIVASRLGCLLLGYAFGVATGLLLYAVLSFKPKKLEVPVEVDAAIAQLEQQLKGRALMPRIPKDVEKYITAKVAGVRLLMTAVQHVLMLKDDVRVKWELKLSFYRPKGPDPDAIAVVHGATFRSGEE